MIGWKIEMFGQRFSHIVKNPLELGNICYRTALTELAQLTAIALRIKFFRPPLTHQTFFCFKAIMAIRKNAITCRQDHEFTAGVIAAAAARQNFFIGTFAAAEKIVFDFESFIFAYLAAINTARQSFFKTFFAAESSFTAVNNIASADAFGTSRTNRSAGGFKHRHNQ